MNIVAAALLTLAPTLALAEAPTWFECIPGQGITYCTDINSPLIKELTFHGPAGSSTFSYETNSLVVCDPDRECLQVASNEVYGSAPQGVYLVASEYRLDVVNGETVAFWDGYGPTTAKQKAAYLREFGASFLYARNDTYPVTCTNDQCQYQGQEISVDALMFLVPMADVIGEGDQYQCVGPVCMYRRGGHVFGLNPEYYEARYQ